MAELKEYFHVNVSKYDSNRNYFVVRPSSLSNPKDHSVMFVTEGFISHWESVLEVKECLVIWPEKVEIPAALSAKHAVLLSPEPRYGFAKFFHDNNITYNPAPSPFDIIEGAYICHGATIGQNTVIFPGAYIGPEVSIGDNCYIASGVRIVGCVQIGHNCIIRENTVIGSDGLTTRRNECGKVLTIPQFGGVTIEDNVQIGANSVICKGAIDHTVIGTGTRIDNETFISHNVHIGHDALIVGETLMMGSSSTGDRVFISGASVVRDGLHIGDDAFIGMGSVVVKNVPCNATVKGVPAR